MRPINSNALGDVWRSLGITGAGSQGTEFDDGVLQQNLTVNEMVRRSRTLAGSSGLFTLKLINEHAAAGDLTVDIDPYEPGEAFVNGVYPPSVPQGFDIWILDAVVTSSRVVAGDSFVITLGSSSSGIGKNDDGTTPSVGIDQIVYVAEGTVLRSTWNVATDILQHGNRHINRRIARHGLLTNAITFWSTATFVGATDHFCAIILGMFPVGMGQDGAY